MGHSAGELRDQKFTKKRPKGDHFLPEKETKRRPILGEKETSNLKFTKRRLKGDLNI